MNAWMLAVMRVVIIDLSGYFGGLSVRLVCPNIMVDRK